MSNILNKTEYYIHFIIIFLLFTIQGSVPAGLHGEGVRGDLYAIPLEAAAEGRIAREVPGAGPLVGDRAGHPQPDFPLRQGASVPLWEKGLHSGLRGGCRKERKCDVSVVYGPSEKDNGMTARLGLPTGRRLSLTADFINRQFESKPRFNPSSPP